MRFQCNGRASRARETPAGEDLAFAKACCGAAAQLSTAIFLLVQKF
jgi:hypothetical protein